MIGLRRGWVFGAALLALSCGGDEGEIDGFAGSIERVAGDSQRVAVTTSSAPLVVRVRDSVGAPLAGVSVNFGMESGAGSVSPVLDTTDIDGLAATVYTATSTTGARKVHAQIAAVGAPGLVFDLQVGPGDPAQLQATAGQDAAANAGAAVPLGVKVLDGFGNAVAGTQVVWSVVSGGGSVGADTVVTDVNGIATVTRTLGAGVGGQFTRAIGVAGSDTLLFHHTARGAMTVLAGGNNVGERYTSDLWVHGDYAYTGTWGGFPRGGLSGTALKVWNVSGGVTLVDSVIFANIQTVSDNEVSADGTLLLSTTEGGGADGLYLHSLADPAHPVQLDYEPVGTGLHTGTFAVIGGVRYVFAAKDPASPALMVYRIQPDSADKIVQVAAVAQPANYGIHDMYVRDGLAFVCDWNAGMRIYDVGDGRAGGSPASPQLVGSIVTATAGLDGARVHNAWWYHDAQGGKRYVFVGQEGPGSVGSSSSGDIHVVDVTNMAAPQEVAFYHLAGAGVHNFWMDEARGILYAAYYNGGLVALDVTGTLSGDLASREIARIQPGGAGNTYVWGVMLANGALWASDMLSGFWKVSVP